MSDTTPPVAAPTPEPRPASGPGPDPTSSAPSGDAHVGEAVAIDAALASGLRRRPSGEPPPLPKHLDRATLVWLGIAGLITFAWIVLTVNATTARAIGIAENELVESIAGGRSTSMEDLLGSVNDLLDGWFVPIVGWGAIVLCALNKRWRHILVLLIALLVTIVAVSVSASLIQRPRPLGVRIVGTWEGWAMPTTTVAMATAVLITAYCCVVPPGRWRRILVIGSVVFLALYGVLEVVIAQAHPTDIIIAVTLGGAIPLLAFRWFTPEDAFPIGTARGGNSAHLDISGARGDAIRAAVEEQLGVKVLEAKPIGGEGSAGSTPIRLKIADPVTGEPSGAMFAKLLARSHLRADRQYKLMRTLAYGRLEDESRFQTVRRLVQQEDYLGLRFDAAGIKVPKTHGIVEITPEAEYLLVTDFLDGYQEIGDAEIDITLIDDALGIVRRMWDSGLAHRDVKPANLMTNGLDVAVIDVGFSQVRPTPWRQAIDLANMMLVLALRSDPDTVYQRALLQFSPDDIAEGFAATHGITVPTQLRQKMKEDGRDLIGAFRALAPDRARISIQRWSARRIGLAIGVLLGGLVLLSLFISNLQAIGLLPVKRIIVTVVAVVAVVGLGIYLAGLGAIRDDRVVTLEDTNCQESNTLILQAQSVPTAQLIPCITDGAKGWIVADEEYSSEGSTVQLNTGDVSGATWTITLTETCTPDPAATERSYPDQQGRYQVVGMENTDTDAKTATDTEWYQFEGGCTKSSVSIPDRFDSQRIFDEMNIGFVFASRASLNQFVEDDTDGRLTLDPPPTAP